MSWAQTLFLKKVIDGKKKFAISDNLIVDIVDADNKIKVKYGEPLAVGGTFKPKISGQLKFTITMSTASSGSTTVYLYVDGVQTRRHENNNSTIPAQHSFDWTVEVVKNKTYQILFATTSGTSTLSKWKVCGDIIDGSTFDYVIGAGNDGL